MFPFSDVMNNDAEASVMGIFMVFYFVFIFFMLALSIAMYVLESVGLYTIAKRRRLRNPWLAWIPVGNVWIVGSISDQYKKEVKGQVKNRRKLLMGLYIATYALLAMFFFCFLAGLIISETARPSMNDFTVPAVLIMLVGVMAYFAAIVVSIVASVFLYMCCYDIFMSCDPDNAVLFLVLSIVFSVVLPIFMFTIRNKDKGFPMPAPVAPVAFVPPAEAPAPTPEAGAEPSPESTQE